MKFVTLAALIAVIGVAVSASGCSGGPGGSASSQDELKAFQNNKVDWAAATPAQRSMLKKQADGTWTFRGFPIPKDSQPPANYNVNGN